MGHLTSALLKGFRAWERSTQIAFALAVLLFFVALMLLVIGPLSLKQPSLIGLIGLLIAGQVIFMWGNRRMVTPYTQAQRAYLAEDFPTARHILETLEAAGKANAPALTLLANTYRQLGLLDESEAVVRKAIAIQPFDHFSLYGFGRTLLIKGLYAEAAVAMRQSLEAGAPPLAHFDLGEALYRQGLKQEACQELLLVSEVGADQEPFRALMTQYLLYTLSVKSKPEPELVQNGLPYWRDHARRFSHTPYGQSLAQDIQHMEAL